MTSQISRVAEDQIADRAALNTDILLFDQLNQLGMLRYRKPVSNPLGPKQNSIVNFVIVARV